jgi:hypothetical protein
MAKTTSNAFTVRIAPPPPPLTASFQLTSAVGGANLPYTIGYAFAKGAVPSGTALAVDQGTAQLVVKRQWNDGSVKHVVVSGHATIGSAGGSQAIQIAAGTPTGGTALTSANIVAAAPTASVQCGAIGTVTLTSLLNAAPFRTWLSGPEMVECHYRGAVGTDATLVAWFHVRLYRTGRIWIRAFCENGYLDKANATKTYVPTVMIGGVAVYSPGTALTHFANTRWDIEGWIGGDPQITPKHNVAQLISTQLVPNYWKRNPSAATLNGLGQVYTPMSVVGWTPDMTNTGFQNAIGLLPLWDALYCTTSDPRAYKAVVASSRSLGTYAIVWRDSSDNLPTRPSARPNYTVEGNNGGGSNGVGAGTLNWDLAHHGSGGYLAYLITGDYYHLETMQHQASVCYLCNTSGNGAGTSRKLMGQSRAMAWALRTVGQLAGIGPSDSVTSDYAALLSGNMAFWRGKLPDQFATQNPLGILYSYEMAQNGYGPGIAAPWQQNFAVQTLGFLSDIEPLADLTTLKLVRDYYYRWPAGLLGGDGPPNYCYTQAGAFNVKIAPGIPPSDSDLSSCFTSWGAVFQNTFGAANGTCGVVLQGTSGSEPASASTGYYGNLMPAIAYAVDHGAPGAAAAWARFSGASNWSTVENSGFGDIPIWGIVPKGFGGT